MPSRAHVFCKDKKFPLKAKVFIDKPVCFVYNNC